MPDGPEKIVFVGGAPRSGTTVVHALLCTSRRVSPYHPEISFFRGIPQSYRNGKLAWEQHTRAFFATTAEFRQVMRETADVPLRTVWRRLGEAPILALKDPLLTPFFHELHELFPAEGAFVVVIRHPYDVVRSRQAVHEKSGAGRPFGPADAAAIARDYAASYQAVLARSFSGRLFMFRYEDLNAEPVRAGLARFLGVDDLDPDRLWNAGHEAAADDPWGSPKYNRPIDLERRLSPLAPELAEATREVCASLMERFGYS